MKYIIKGVTRQTKHPEITSSCTISKSDEDYGNLNFPMMTRAITQPFEMVSKTHAHEFDQFLIFRGGDPTNMLDLGGEVEITLGEDMEHLEKHVITQASTIFIPKGLYHCPLIHKRVERLFLLAELERSINVEK